MKKDNLAKFIFKLLIVIYLSLSGCQSNNRENNSGIEKKYLDMKLIKEIKENYDSCFFEKRNKGDFRIIEHYFTNDSIEKKIIKDSNNIVVAISIEKNGKSVFVEEYYPNGQSKGSVSLNKQGDIDGKVQYYYQDGRIKLKGQYNNGNETGLWYGYDTSGNLKSVESYGREKQIDTN
jgi:antitoxin component YwqK of YwqJK toxin-antitoxin module